MENTEAPDYMNEHVFCRNRLPPRAYFLPAECLSLAGRWRFHYASSPLEPEPLSDEADAWSLIDVPGHWQLQGFGHPHYTNFNYPFPAKPPYVPSENPTGLYETSFSVPAHWEVNGGFRYRLRFEGVDSAYHLFVNGKEIGYNQGSRNAAEFDISDSIRTGDAEVNTVKVKVYQWSDGSYIEDQDMWWLSGIFRDVYLLAFPRAAHVEDIFVRTDLDSQYKDANLCVDLSFQAQEAAKVSLILENTAGQSVLPPIDKVLEPDNTATQFQVKVSNPLKWTAEHPVLYRLQLQLLVGDRVLQQINQVVGFRTVELKDGLVQVNGRPITFRGVNRHDHHPRFGRAVPLDFIKKDLLLMKQHNVNALRCSHYPNDPRLVQIANEIGLYVMDEADLECHGMGIDIDNAPSDNPTWRGAYLDRMQQVVHRDKNNPSVIMWSLGNESFFGQNHVAMYKWSKEFDRTRLVHYEGDHSYQASDIASSMYNQISDLVNLGNQQGKEAEKPVLLQEYGHAMGNGPGALQEYQDTFYKYRRLQGGFIWEWANHGLVKKLDDKSGKSFYAYGGDFGDEPNDYNFVMDGLCTSEHHPGPGLVELKKVYQPITMTMDGDQLLVRNRYDFVSLGDLQYTWTIVRFYGEQEQVLVSQTEQLLSGATWSGHEFSLGPFNQSMTKCDLSKPETWLCISFRTKSEVAWAGIGHEIAWAQFRLDKPRENLPASLTGTFQHPYIDEQGTTLRISAPTFEISFDRIKAKMMAWSYKGIYLMSERADPSLSFWRAPTDNDKPNSANIWRGWGLHQMTQQIRSVRHHHVEATNRFEIIVESWIAPPILAWGFETTTTYTISSAGQLSIRVHAIPKGYAPSILPRVGFEMLLPKDRKFAQWFGLGPGQSYRDMKEAGKIGVWKRSIDEMMVNYEMPQENGNRTETRWVKVIDERGVGIKASLQREPHEDTTNHGRQHQPREGAEPDNHRPHSPLDAWEVIHRPKKQSSSVQAGFDFAVSKYTSEDLDQAQHPHELHESDGIVFRIDDDHHGLGSASCGPDTLDQYQLKMREFDFTIHLEATGV